MSQELVRSKSNPRQYGLRTTDDFGEYVTPVQIQKSNKTGEMRLLGEDNKVIDYSGPFPSANKPKPKSKPQTQQEVRNTPRRPMLFPFSMPEGATSIADAQFDSNVGVLGSAKRFFTLPKEAWDGKFDATSEDSIPRMLEAATWATPVSSALRAKPTSINPVMPKVPTTRQLKRSASAKYTKAEDAGLEYSAASVSKLADDMERALTAETRIAETNPELYSKINQLRNQPAGAVAARLESLDVLRRQLQNIAGHPKPEKSSSAIIALNMLDNFLERNISTSNVARPATATGTLSTATQREAADRQAATEAVQTLKDARTDRAAAFRSEELAKLQKKGELRAGSTGAGKNADNATRQNLVNLLTNEGKIRGFNATEKAFIEKIIMGGKGKNAARLVGNLLGGGGGLGAFASGTVGSGAGFLAGGTPGAVVGSLLLPAVGRASKSVANALTKKEMKTLTNMVNSRSSLYRDMVKEAPRIKSGPMVNPEGKAGLAKALWQSVFPTNASDLGESYEPPPQVPLTSGGGQADLLQQRFFEQMKRAGIPVT